MRDLPPFRAQLGKDPTNPDRGEEEKVGSLMPRTGKKRFFPFFAPSLTCPRVVKALKF